MISMHARKILGMAALAACWVGPAQSQTPPSSEEQAALIAETRGLALAYTRSLPDFLCTEVTRRYSAPAGQSPEPAWKLLDTLTIRLTYFDRKEAYQVFRVNDKPADKNLSKMGGWTTKGDFGSMLLGVFEPKAEAQFTWERWDAWKDRRVAVFAWRIERKHSGFTSTAHAFIKTVRANWGAKGLVHIDAETRQVLSLTIDSMDMPAESPTRDVHIVLDYGFQKIGDSNYLLPAHSLTVTTVKTGKVVEKSDSEFVDYKKFSTDTKIQFGSGEAR